MSHYVWTGHSPCSILQLLNVFKYLFTFIRSCIELEERLVIFIFIWKYKTYQLHAFRFDLTVRKKENEGK